MSAILRDYVDRLIAAKTQAEVEEIVDVYLGSLGMGESVYENTYEDIARALGDSVMPVADRRWMELCEPVPVRRSA